MIAEYALEPEMVATWGRRLNHRFFIRAFGCGQGRLVSRYPKKWAKRVWESFTDGTEMERKRLEELLVQIQKPMIKRKGYLWNEHASWLDNAVEEHNRHPFRAILARSNPAEKNGILCEDSLAATPCQNWDTPHGMTVNRNGHEMAAPVYQMLTCCRWVKFIDPYLSPGRNNYRQTIQTFLSILARERPIGPPESIEFHTHLHDGTTDFLRNSFLELIPSGLHISLYQWQERSGGQRLHNRYILTDLGGVSFHHGLDSGSEGETDDLTRLDNDQYDLRCRQYDPRFPAFDSAAAPLNITGTLGG